MYPFLPVGGIPAFTEGDPDVVLSPFQHIRDIVGEVHHAVVAEIVVIDLDIVAETLLTGAVHGLIGRIVVLAHSFAIDAHLEHPKAADVCGRLSYRAVQVDCFAEFRCMMDGLHIVLLPFPRSTDPFGFPFRYVPYGPFGCGAGGKHCQYKEKISIHYLIMSCITSPARVRPKIPVICERVPFTWAFLKSPGSSSGAGAWPLLGSTSSS